MPDSVPAPDTAPAVLIEIQSGDGLSLSAAGRLFPAHRGEGPVVRSTVFHWRHPGARAPNGQLVRLEAVRVGGRWLTSRGDVARFVAALTAAADAPQVPAAPVLRTPTDRRRAENAIAALKKKGA